MKRRRLLGAVASGAALLAGCTGSASNDGPAGEGDGSPTADPTPTGTTRPEGTPTATPTGEPTPTADPVYRTLSVERVENVTATVTHALRLNEMGPSPQGDLPRLTDFSERKRKVLEAAIGGTYETEDPPAWLAEFVGSTRFVRADGAHYRVENTLPTYTVTAETVPESDVSGKVADSAAYEEAVTHDGRVMTGLVRIARREGATFTYLWPSLRDFLDEYAAVRYHGKLVSLSVQKNDPGAPYTVTAERIPPTELTEQPVWNATEAPADLRELVRKAGDTEGVYRVDEPPEKLLERLRANQYVYLDGTFYTTYVSERGPVPVSMTASFPDELLDDDGAVLRLALRNDHDGEVSITSGAPLPFGVLRYHPEGAPEETETLWSEAYAESDHVYTDGHDVEGVNSIALSKTVPEGGSVEQTFVVEDTDLQPGTYVVEGSVGVGVGEDDGGTFSYRVVFTVG